MGQPLNLAAFFKERFPFGLFTALNKKVPIELSWVNLHLKGTSREDVPSQGGGEVSAQRGQSKATFLVTIIS